MPHAPDSSAPPSAAGASPCPRRGAIACAHPAGTAAAREAYAAGGNAVDAAVAAAAALTVVYPHMTSVGGDLIALVREPDGTTRVVNASGPYGSGPVGHGLDDGMPLSGPLTVSVPGVAAGWHHLLTRWGALDVAEVLTPAIELAHRGAPVAPGLARALDEHAAELLRDPGMRAVFFRDGVPARSGEVLRQSALAQTLGTLAERGLRDLYEGEAAGRLAAGLAELGVPVLAEDLARFEPVEEEPLALAADELTAWTAGPNSQGFSFLRSLHATLRHRSDEDAAPWAVLAELFHAGDWLRDTILADPRVVPVDVAPYLSAEGADRAWQEASAVVASGVRPSARRTPRPAGDTVGIAAVDEDGRAVSLIQSVFHAFGALVLEPRTGLVLHNRAAFFTTDPSSPNRVAPGKRPAHTLVPVLLALPDGTVAAHATMGGKAQSQIHTQLALRTLSGLAPQDAVAAPRFVVGGMDAGTDGEHILAEEGLEPDRLAQLPATGMRIVRGARYDHNAGHSMIARLRPDGSFEAGADPRSDGEAWTSR